MSHTIPQHVLVYAKPKTWSPWESYQKERGSGQGPEPYRLECSEIRLTGAEQSRMELNGLRLAKRTC